MTSMTMPGAFWMSRPTILALPPNQQSARLPFISTTRSRAGVDELRPTFTKIRVWRFVRQRPVRRWAQNAVAVAVRTGDGGSGRIPAARQDQYRHHRQNSQGMSARCSMCRALSVEGAKVARDRTHFSPEDARFALDQAILRRDSARRAQNRRGAAAGFY